jgi:hypothetical protein
MMGLGSRQWRQSGQNALPLSHYEGKHISRLGTTTNVVLGKARRANILLFRKRGLPFALPSGIPGGI